MLFRKLLFSLLFVLLSKGLMATDATTSESIPIVQDKQQISKSQKRYLVVSITFAGMGNRLRVIASAEIVARITGRQLVVDWPINIHMPGHWQNFFSSPLVTFDSSDLPGLGYSLEKIKLAPKNDPEIKNLGEQNNCYAELEVLPHLSSFDEPIVYFASTLPFKPITMERDEYDREMTAIYKRLVPNEWIQKEVKDFRDINKFDDYYMIGVHYRGWQMGETDKNTKLTNDPSNKHVNLFIETMTKEFVRPLSRTDHKPVAFFLAADNQDAKNALLNEPLFKGRIFNRPEGIERNSIRGQESAMVDFFLLSSTNFVIGTTASSFSREAARLTKQNKKISMGESPYIKY